MTWWAKTFYVLAVLGAMLWFVRSQRKKVLAKQKELEKEQALNEELQFLNLELKDINEANQRFVPQDFMQILGKKRIQDLKLGDQTQIKMTILFSDIRSYTMLSETMSPDDNFKFINGYLGRIGPIIKKHGGFIDKYMGDGLMALFLDDHQSAIKAAVEMQKLLEEYNVERESKGRQSIRTGMGLNTGPLMLGIIGDQNRYDSTVIADAVNTASRMEGLTKIFGVHTIISEHTLNELGDQAESIAHRYIGRIRVKGKERSIGVYDIYEGDPVAERQLKARTLDHFDDGMEKYTSKDFGKAAEAFKVVLETNENDLTAQYYLDKCVDYIVNDVPENWTAVEEMVMK
jgi:class 3 adenylate cyclase